MTIHKRHPALLLSALLGWLSACSSQPSQTDACTAFAQASCDALQRCNPDSFYRTYGDSATCNARQQLSCGYQFPPNSNTTTQTFVDCATAVTAAACGQLLVNQAVVITNLTECRPLPGNLDVGRVCFADTQCKSTFCNKGLLGGLCGECAQRALINEDCTATACDFGLICSQQNGPPARCVAPFTVGVGQNCDQTARCSSGLVCVGQRCTAILKAGDACMPNGGGGGQGNDACDRTQGLSCDQNTMRCVATQYAKAGQACGGQRITCTGSSRCVNDTTCLGPAGDGQSANYNCLPPAIPVNGICSLPDVLLCE